MSTRIIWKIILRSTVIYTRDSYERNQFMKWNICFPIRRRFSLIFAFFSFLNKNRVKNLYDLTNSFSPLLIEVKESLIINTPKDKSENTIFTNLFTQQIHIEYLFSQVKE